MATPIPLDRRTQRREQILGAAWQIATETGLASVSLHEVARRVGMKQPSLYSHVASKLDLYDAMFADAYSRLLQRLDAQPATGSARRQLLDFSTVVLDFVVESPARQQLLFQRTIPGFEPSAESFALAEQLITRARRLLAALGVDSDEQLDVYTALLAGLGSQQVANDPGGDRWRRLLRPLLELFLDHFPHRTDQEPS